MEAVERCYLPSPPPSSPHPLTHPPTYPHHGQVECEEAVEECCLLIERRGRFADPNAHPSLAQWTTIMEQLAEGGGLTTLLQLASLPLQTSGPTARTPEAPIYALQV